MLSKKNVKLVFFFINEIREVLSFYEINIKILSIHL